MLKVISAIQSAIYTKYGLDLNLTLCDLPDFQTIQNDFSNGVQMINEL
jgi:hypothetical protein